VRILSRYFAIIAFTIIASVTFIGLSIPAYASTTQPAVTKDSAPSIRIGGGGYEYNTQNLGDCGGAFFSANPGRPGVPIVVAVQLESSCCLILGTNLHLTWINKTTGASGSFELANSEGMSTTYSDEFDVNHVGSGSVKLAVTGTIDTVDLGESIIEPLILAFNNP